MIFTQDYCKNTGGVCQAASAGLYYINNSSTAVTGVRRGPGNIWQWGSSAALTQDGLADEVLDAMSIRTEQGLITVKNSTISAIREEFISYANGSYSPEVGILSLGGTGNGDISLPNATGKNFPGWLTGQDLTSSNSFGLHYGSASLGLEASLVWGGYDQSRVIGEVGVFALNQEDSLILALLVDIQIGVEDGTSPFAEGDSIANLLHQKPDFRGHQPAIINPILPYFFFSPETCVNIVKYLPVTLQRDISLYIWNTTDPQYQRIVQSPSYLALIFETTSNNLTIKIPFQLLNLTLEPPIVPSRRQYFPCQPFHAKDNSGNYYLGRVFLQAAFLGMDWGSSTFFLAQGPGPGAKPPNVKPIQPKDRSLSSDTLTTFSETWSNNWIPLAPQSQPNNTNTSTDATKSTSASTSAVFPTDNVSKVSPVKSSVLSNAAKAGVGLGVVMGVALATIAFVTLIFHQRRRRVLAVPSSSSEGSTAFEINRLYEKDLRVVTKEIGGEGLPHEAPTDRGVHGMYEQIVIPNLH